MQQHLPEGIAMPTGYTADIKDGITFQQYAMNCARAFGACVTIREESGKGEAIPESFEPSNWNADKLKELRADLARLRGLSPQEATEDADVAWHDAENRRLARAADKQAQKESYEAMLKQVLAWNPPRADHDGLRKFMAEQITSSIDFDCGDSSYDQQKPRLTGDEWREQEIDATKKSIAYHEKANAEEIERTDKRNEWVRLLRESVAA